MTASYEAEDRHPGRPADAGLAPLYDDLVAARAVVRDARRTPQRSPERSLLAGAELLSCLEAYADALASRHLPVPPAIRDEIRLRRLLAGRAAHRRD
jgi:hypothetical protein